MIKNQNLAIKIKVYLNQLVGWRRWFIIGSLGMMAALALPPLYLLPFLIPAFTCLFWIIEGNRSSGFSIISFIDGWWFGLGFFTAGLYWISFSFFVDAAQYGFLAPFAVAGIASGMAFFPALVALFSNLIFNLYKPSCLGRVFIFSALWTAAEWSREWVLSGFPWNSIGTVWVISSSMIQLAALTGVYGLSLLAVAGATMPAVLGESLRRWPAVAVTMFIICLIWLIGNGRLLQASDQFVPNVHLRLVQPNIPQALKWKPELLRSHVIKQLAMSTAIADSEKQPTHVIWAETAVPYIIKETPGLSKTLGLAAPLGGLLITGAPRSSSRAIKSPQLWNSLFAISPNGQIVATYDKFHLVPFGEYVPLRDFLPVNKLTAGRQDFSPGSGVKTFKLNGLPPVSILICYEVIFSSRVVASERPSWLLNITNDGWFGSTSGPYQHFAAAKLRSVEEGLPLVRVANTGISGVIDAYGRTVQILGLGKDGIIDSGLPVALTVSTPYSRLGDGMTIFIIFLFLGAGLISRRIETDT
jgi:apolipoprotein N-acyltransferase